MGRVGAADPPRLLPEGPLSLQPLPLGHGFNPCFHPSPYLRSTASLDILLSGKLLRSSEQTNGPCGEVSAGENQDHPLDGPEGLQPLDNPLREHCQEALCQAPCSSPHPSHP